MTSVLRERNREAKRRSRAADPVRDAAVQRRWRTANPEKAGAWQATHRAEINARRRAERAAESLERREARLARQRCYQYPEKDKAYREAHREERAAYAGERWRSMTTEERRRYSSESWRRTGRLHRYGVTEEEFLALLEQQQGRCAICQTPLDDSSRSTRPHLDHNHVTGVVRGILCLNCNAMLGHARDDLARLMAGADYLAREARDH